MVESSLAKFRKRYPGQDIQLSIPEEFIMVSADAILIEQVLVNLLENAVQHAKGMTQLRVAVEALTSSVRFEVIDDGCGIKKRSCRIFLRDAMFLIRRRRITPSSPWGSACLFALPSSKLTTDRSGLKM